MLLSVWDKLPEGREHTTAQLPAAEGNWNRLYFEQIAKNKQAVVFSPLFKIICL